MKAVSAIAPERFRKVLGGYPTGVSVITSSDADGNYGMVVGTFTSISLAPPLVGFFADKSSTSWPRIAGTGRFCVNVLGADQLAACRRFAGKHENKFEDHSYSPSPGGLPILDAAIAWIECDISQVTEIGDHLLVVGLVNELDRRENTEPLLFFSGSYYAIQPLAVT